MPHALITGGAGFIGSHLAEYMLAQGDKVTIIDDLSTGSFDNIAHLTQNSNFRYVIEDIRNTQVIDRLMSECDLVIHLAAAVGVEKIINEPINSIEVNIGGTEVLLKTATRYRKKILIASTSEVYGKGVKFPFEEDDDRLLGATSKSRWSYATAKAIDEFLALAYHYEVGLPVVLFRLFNTVGPRQSGQYGMVVPRFVQWALANEPIQVYGDGEQTRCFCNVKDVIQGIYALTQNDDAIGQLYNIGSDEEISIKGLAERIIERAGSKSTIEVIPYEQAYSAPGFEDFRRRVPSIKKITQAIGWKPASDLNETIDDTIAFYRNKA